MEAARRPLWEFGPNRVKAVGGDPRILIDSANTHTLSTRRGLALACMCKTLPQGPADIAHCWHVHHLAPGLGQDHGVQAPLGTSCQRAPMGRPQMKKRSIEMGSAENSHSKDTTGFATMQAETCNLPSPSGQLVGECCSQTCLGQRTKSPEVAN